jgi:GT2 family glycosyltransferase
MKKNKEPFVSILVINWNGVKDSIECLNSMLKINYSNYNIVVYDNGSTKNETIELKEKFKKYKNIDFVRSEKNWGYDEGCNQAIRYSKKKYNPDYYVVANNDITVDKNFLLEFIKEMEKDPKIGGASPIIYYYDRPKEVWWFGDIKYNAWTGKVKVNRKQNKTSGTDMITGCLMILKKDVVEKVGLLNPKFFLSGSDTFEYSIRMKRKGFKLIYVPSSKIWHKCGNSAWKLTPKDRLRHEIVGIIETLKIIRWYQMPLNFLSMVYQFIKLRSQGILIFIFNKKKRNKFLKSFKN